MEAKQNQRPIDVQPGLGNPESLLKEFLDVLQREQQALLGSDVEQIEQIAIEKQVIVLALADFGEMLEASDDAVQKQLVVSLIECRRYHEQNAALINQGLKVCSRSLDYLFNITGTSRVAEYDMSGKVAFKPGNRRLGAA